MHNIDYYWLVYLIVFMHLILVESVYSVSIFIVVFMAILGCNGDIVLFVD